LFKYRARFEDLKNKNPAQKTCDDQKYKNNSKIIQNVALVARRRIRFHDGIIWGNKTHPQKIPVFFIFCSF
jgi:hypothetical protein